MARLRDQFITRIEAFADRVLDVAEALRRTKCPAFVRDQMSRSGTSVGSNACEASEALTQPDFCHRLGTSARELSETKYWLRMVVRRQWVKPGRMTGLLDEGEQLTKIIATILIRSEASDDRPVGRRAARGRRPAVSPI